MPLVYCCIAPHGSEIVPELAGEMTSLFSPTRSGMRVLAKEMGVARPQTIVVATPHNLRLPTHIGVVTSENSSGRVVDGRRKIQLHVKCDVDYAQRVLKEAEEMGLPVVGANYGTSEGPLSDMPMDWGTLIPLWFFVRKQAKKADVAIVSPSRGIPLHKNYEFGAILARVAQKSKKRVAIVASADQAHAHRRDGPYGFSKCAQEYDDLVIKSIKGDKLKSIMEIASRVVDGAKPDSLWQMSMLAGALSVVPMVGRLVSYQRPTYYGMICAGYRLTKPTG